MTVLLTGFEPFGADTRNPSGEVVAALDGRRIDGHPIRTAVLPVSARDAPPALRRAIGETAPVLVVMLGLAGGRTALSLERVAINILDFERDNAGAGMCDEPVVPGGPDGLFSTLPGRAILEAWRRAGIPGYLSDTAGTYMCNQVLYHALCHADGRYRAGFIHLPYSSEQAAQKDMPPPSLPLDLMCNGVLLALEASLSAGEV